MAAACAHFKAAKTDAKGIALSAHYRQAERTTPGFKAPKPPPFPETLHYLWTWFCELDMGRSGIVPLSWSDFDAWARLTGRTLRPFETRILRALDRKRLEALNG